MTTVDALTAGAMDTTERLAADVLRLHNAYYSKPAHACVLVANRFGGLDWGVTYTADGGVRWGSAQPITRNADYMIELKSDFWRRAHVLAAR